ncbi:MAG: aspartate kinase [Gemmatimonadota bacterium]|nr:aspartate kinase [Gemmatimonadota bacterium]
MPGTKTQLEVHKFGGAALADAEAIRHAARIITTHRAGPVVIVASAMFGVTDSLIELATLAACGERDTVKSMIARLRDRHLGAAAVLELADSAAVTRAITAHFDELANCCEALSNAGACSPAARDSIIARGELLAAHLLAGALGGGGISARFVQPGRVIMTDGRAGNAAPDLARTTVAAEEHLAPLLQRGVIPVVPGFVGAAPDGTVVTLGRGGSDLTATVLARVLRARQIVLWKDVAGLLTADPRVVPTARLIPRMHYREASELAYYGAKVLHPRALIVLGEGALLHIRPLADPAAPGTLISGRRAPSDEKLHPVKALAAIREQAVVQITGNGMAGVPGIAARAFGALERAAISVSLISQASSEHSICLVISGGDATVAAQALSDAFAGEIERGDIDAVEVQTDAVTIAVVGLGMAGTPGISGRLFGALGDAKINIIAIAQGASELNISFVVNERDSVRAQRAVHAAFRLDKIGGGAAERAAHADVAVLGYGKIGRELVAQLARVSEAHGVRVVAVIDRSGYVFDPRGLSSRKLAALAKHKTDGRALAAAPGGVKAGAAEALTEIASHALSRPILVDATADDTGAVLQAAIVSGMDLVLANKRPLADAPRKTSDLARSAAKHGRRVLHEATVGAGLPIIDTVNKLLESGDRVLRIEGCPSGTLGYLFGELGRGTPFSTALRAAMSLGYTEPDPREDLSGNDVARKGLILGRLLGFDGDLDDVDVESLVPESHRALPLDEFLARLGEVDDLWMKRVAQARERGTVLRYRATVTKQRVRVGVVAVATASALGALTGTDNQFAFTTKRYKSNPLVITGAGAGAGVTAAGVLNDVLKLAGAR